MTSSPRAPVTRSSSLYALRSFHEYLRSDDLIAINSTLGLTLPERARPARKSTRTPRPGRSGLGGRPSRCPRPARPRYARHASRYTGRRDGVSVSRLEGVDRTPVGSLGVGNGDKPSIVPLAPPLVPIFKDHFAQRISPAGLLLHRCRATLEVHMLPPRLILFPRGTDGCRPSARRYGRSSETINPPERRHVRTLNRPIQIGSKCAMWDAKSRGRGGARSGLVR
jgi:hypothetical protein